jgi:hypothetical protein
LILFFVFFLIESIGIVVVLSYGRNRTYVLFGKDKEMKEIIEGILKELRIKYITENDHEKREPNK